MDHDDDGRGERRHEFAPAIVSGNRKPQRYVLRNASSLEAALVRVLDFIGLDFTIPTFSQRLPRKGIVVKRPWFPGYVFVTFDPLRDRWQQIARAPGVIAILGSPTAIDEDEYNDMIARCQNSVFTNDEHSVIPAGSRIVILDGAMRGQSGVVVSSKQSTVWAEVMSFNRPTRVELPTKNVMILR